MIKIKTTTADWQPIETAPTAEWVLVWGPSSIVRAAAKCRVGAHVWWLDGDRIGVEITHWAPLPEPPAH